MTHGLAVALFSGVIVAGAMAGALVPLFAGGERRLLPLLSFAAGVMFGAAFFHMLPEAFRAGGYGVFSLVPAGFLALFLLERYVLVHVCEEPADFAHHGGHGRWAWPRFSAYPRIRSSTGLRLARRSSKELAG